MPYLTKTICNYSRCSKPVISGQRYCNRHKKEQPQNQSQSHPFYHSSRYRKARNRYVRENPRCNDCDKLIQQISNRHLDHIRPWQTGSNEYAKKELFWNADNWQTLCHSCHSKKTRKEQ